MDRTSLLRLFDSNPVSLLRLLANKVNTLRRLVRQSSLDLSQHEALLREWTQRHTREAAPVETLSVLGNQIAAAHGGSIGAMSADCTEPLLLQYLEILQEPDPTVRLGELISFLEQYVPSLMVTLADLNSLRCPDDDPSTWVTEQEMNARQFLYPYSDPPCPD